MSNALSPSDAPSAVLVRYPNWIGDAIMALPVLEVLRALWPRASLGVQAHSRVRGLLEGHPAVGRFHPVPVRGEVTWSEALQSLRGCAYPLGLLLTPSFSSALQFFLGGVRERVGWTGEMRDALLTRRVAQPPRTTRLGLQYQELLRPLGWVGPPQRAHFAPPATDRASAGAWLAERGLSGARPVALAPGAAYGPAKRWPAGHYRELARRVAEELGVPVVALGSRSEAPLLASVVEGVRGAHAMAGELNLRASAALLAQCRALVGNDSGTVHLARAVGTPVVVLFGSSSPDWSGPEADEGEALYRGLDCSPCFKRDCPLTSGRFACLTGLEVAEALAALGRVTGSGR